MPLIGGMVQLRGDPLARIRELRARHGGFVRLGPLRDRQVYLLTEPGAIRHVLLDGYKGYKKGLVAQRLRPVLGQGSLLLEGDAWRTRRRLVQPAFHRQKISALATAFTAGADAMIERWRASIDAGRALDARDEMLRLTMGLTLRNMFRAEAAELRPLVDAWHVLYDELTRNRLRLLRRPSWMPDAERDRAAAAKATVHRILGELISARAAADDGSVVALLLRARDEEGGGTLSEAELRDEVMTLFIGGYETSSNGLAFAFALLGAHPDVAERLRAEVDAVLGARPPTSADLASLSYTRAVLDETLRLYPPSWMITREALADDVVAGFQVRRGDQLLISSYGVHHAPELWPSPDRFDPTRFLPGATEPPRFAYLPFGGGPRMCLGDQYALTEMQLVLARVAQRLTWRLAPGTVIAPHAHVGLRPRHPLRIVARWVTLAPDPRTSAVL